MWFRNKCRETYEDCYHIQHHHYFHFHTEKVCMKISDTYYHHDWQSIAWHKHFVRGDQEGGSGIWGLNESGVEK